MSQTPLGSLLLLNAFFGAATGYFTWLAVSGWHSNAPGQPGKAGLAAFFAFLVGLGFLFFVVLLAVYLIRGPRSATPTRSDQPTPKLST
jgi:hypothetical protein